MSLRALVRALPLLTVVLVPACGESTGNKSGPASKVVLVSDPLFSATVGTVLSAPITVRVTDDQDRNVAGAIVQFTVLQGSASLSASSDTTDRDGIAQTTLTVGQMTGPVSVRATVSGISASVQVTGIAIPGALARLVLLPKPLVLRSVGDTARLVANLTDQFGNTLPSSAITWRSLDETVVTVDASGLVTGRKAAASTRVIASTSSGIADTVTVSVADPNASVCASIAVTLQPGESVVADRSVGACIRADVASEYVAVPYFASNSPLNTTEELRVLGVGVSTFSGFSGSAAARSSSPSPQLTGGPPPVRTFESALRATEQRELTGRIAGARAQRARASGAAFSMIPNTLRVGDVITLNASGTDACTTPNNRQGRVAAISQKAVIIHDQSNPAGGFDDTDYVRIGAMFDTLVVPATEPQFGAPGDIDANGRSVIFYTSAVNQLTAANSGSYVGGFFFGRDLFPRTGTGACATSNEGEIFYMLVPDPMGTLGNTFSKTFVEQVTIGTLAHEYQHLINASRRLTNGSTAFEATWLNEGLSHIAEELTFYRSAARQPRTNIGGAAFGEVRFDIAYAAFMHQNIGRLRSWLTAPESNTPFGPDNLASRGSAWALLRYLADRNGPSDGDVWMRLVNNVNTGMTNLEQVFAVNGLTAVRDWSIAMYADDYAAAPPSIFQMPSWNFRTLFPGMVNSTAVSVRNSSIAGPYPLLVRPLSNEIWRSITLKGGSASFLPFTVAAGTEAQLSITTAGGQPAPTAVTMTILRTK
ncbi:MAG: hypothetical protein H0X64_08660 [Gemmatimonadaceae bacterium]|nr:hypothetical protein [Gemmatimonadaceae bacterium]